MLKVLNRHLIKMFHEVVPLLSTYPMSINYLYTLDEEEYLLVLKTLEQLNGDPLCWKMFEPIKGCGPLIVYPRLIQVHVFLLDIEELPLYVNARDPYFRTLVKYRLREGV